MPPYRKRLRLPGYDYASAGCYFVTVTTSLRQPWFGTIQHDHMKLNDAGYMVLENWFDLPNRFPAIHLDDMILMPDHLHGIVVLGYEPDSKTMPKLGTVIGAFKSLTAVQYGRGVITSGWMPYERQLWQRGYYDHIIRDEQSLERHRAYMESNPALLMAKHQDSMP